MRNLNGAQRVADGVRLYMEVHQIGASFAELLHIADGAVYHQMHVQKHIRRLAKGFHHGNPDGDVWDKHSVHDVYMDIISTRCGDLFHFSAQFCKIG